MGEVEGQLGLHRRRGKKGDSFIGIGRNQSMRLKILDMFTRSADIGVGGAPFDGTKPAAS